MKECKVPYGKGRREIFLPDDIDLIFLEPEASSALSDPAGHIVSELAAQADLLARPTGKAPSSDGAFSAGGVAIAVNDKTRPVPHQLLVPPLVEALVSAGWRRDEITFIIAVGAHLPMSEKEFSLVLPDGVAEGCTIVSHDADASADLVYLGRSSRGTPCRINRRFMEASLRIVVGNIEPHQFMGWSGGVKSASIGLAARQTIAANHSLLASEGAGPCLYDNNPVRQDVEEMGRMAGVHLALNVVMNRDKQIVAALAGSPEEVMRRGIAAGKGLFTVPSGKPADLVIVSPGGHPKDINFYQAQKALRHGARAAKPGAPIIILAACPEGPGSELYEKWMADKKSHKQAREAFAAEEFLLGHHKGMLVAADAEDRDVYLVSDMPDKVVSKLLLKPLANPSQLVAELCRRKPGLRIAVIPYGNVTVPAAAG